MRKSRAEMHSHRTLFAERDLAMWNDFPGKTSSGARMNFASFCSDPIGAPSMLELGMRACFPEGRRAVEREVYLLLRTCKERFCMYRSRRKLIPYPAFFLVLILLPLAASGQQAGLSGTVKDASGNPVAGAAVSAKNTATAQTAQAETDASGAYNLPSLPAGSYEVTVTAKGYSNKAAQVTLTGHGAQALSVILAAAPAGQELPSAPSPAAQEPSLQDLGFSPSQTKADPKLQARLNKRTEMLKIHQTLGLITLAPMAADLITGPMAKVKGKDGQPLKMPTQANLDMHAALGSATAALYFSSAYFAMFAPKVPDVHKRGAIRVHEALALIHGPGMILTPILGSMAFSQEQNGEKVHGIASAHGAVAAVTVIAYAGSIVAVSWPIHLKFWEKK
jgi:hypothetical protein